MEDLKKICKSIYLPFLVLAILLLYIYIPINKFYDDLWFEDILNNQGLFEYLKSRYVDWTSRVVIETVLVSVSNTHVNLFVWKFINVLMFELLMYSVYKIFIKDIKKQKNKLILIWLFVLGILTIPKKTLSDTGWIATTTNYLWVLSLGMFVFTLIKKNINGEKIKWYNTVTFILATIYSSNQEQMVAVLLGVFTLYFLYLIKKKELNPKSSKTLILVYCLIILSFAFILICPGNLARKISETRTWYPEYENFGFFSKIQLSITSMMKYLIIDGKISFILLTTVSAYYIFKEYKNLLLRLNAIIPVIGSTLFCTFNKTIGVLLPGLENLIDIYLKNELVINQSNLTDLKLYIPILFYLLILACILINLYHIFKKTKSIGVVIIIYGLGLATRMIMGFSPTVFASGERPSLILYFSFILLTLLVFKRMLNKNVNVLIIQVIYVVSTIFNFWEEWII